ncbi:RNA polymerase sigma-70 factor [Paenarthrobacter sp. YIM B13468]|uniref:RNA polymerase sigma-70 factor n=1 Tax=Paenarthrobacter sp. YIM B13468 TaxID=3366295 RepID=UPI00366C9C36
MTAKKESQFGATVPAARQEIVAAHAVFNSVRPRLFGIAYRMLGSVSDAEDIVQDVWLRWQTYDSRSAVRNPAAFLATTTTRIAINMAQSARTRHETYVGPWLPEPVDTSQDPAMGAERAEALGFAVLLTLEKLSPTERAAYVLREAFDYPYQQIAEIIQANEATARQLVSRARKHIRAERRKPVAVQEQQRLLEAFIAAAQTGDLSALEQLFSADVVSYSDGGGVVRASRIPVFGRERVAKYIRAFADRFWVGVTVSEIQANGQASMVLARKDDGFPFAVVTVTVSQQGIDQVLWMMNPEKLGGIPS